MESVETAVKNRSLREILSWETPYKIKIKELSDKFNESINELNQLPEFLLAKK